MKKLNFEQIKEEILNYNAKSEYKQASIVILRNIFEQAEIEQLTILGVSGSAFTILNKGEIVENILFKTPEEARNYIKMKYPKRRFKEDKENVFVCANYGTKFIIQEQHYR